MQQMSSVTGVSKSLQTDIMEVLLLSKYSLFTYEFEDFFYFGWGGVESFLQYHYVE